MNKPPLPPLPGKPEPKASGQAVQTTLEMPVLPEKPEEKKEELPKYPEGGKIVNPLKEVKGEVPEFMKQAVEEHNEEVKAQEVPENPFLTPPPTNAVQLPTATPPPTAAPPLPGAVPPQVGANPFAVNNSMYELRLPQNPTKRFKEIFDSKKPVDQMTQEELREVYYNITGRMGAHIYTATTINHIAKTGKHPDQDDREESEWMFIGSCIHEAAETQGESLKKLFYFDGDTIPEKPDEYKNLSKDHREIAEAMILEGLSDLEAYMRVKDTVAVRKVKKEWLAEDYVFSCDQERKKLNEELADMYEERDHNPEIDEKVIEKAIAQKQKEIDKVKDSAEKKAVLAVAKSAATEYDKIKGAFPRIKKYLEDIDKYEKKKEDVRKRAAKVEGAIVIDDIDYISMRGFRVYETIAKTYGALFNSKDAFNVYHPQNISNNNFELYSEYVMLGSIKLKNGKEVPARSMVDRLIFDHTEKVVWCIDLKTHGGKENFLKGNYVKHNYDRAMSFYEYMVSKELEKRDLTGYRIMMSILPISIVSLEVGASGISLLNISAADLNRGRYGGVVKPDNFAFINNEGWVQRTADEELMEWMNRVGATSEKTYDNKTRGWESIVENFEMNKLPGAN